MTPGWDVVFFVFTAGADLGVEMRHGNMFDGLHAEFNLISLYDYFKHED